MTSDSIFVKKLVWKELEDKGGDVDDPFSDGKKHVLVESVKEYELPKSMFANALILGESAPHPPLKTELDYYALMKDGKISAVLGIEQSTTSGKSNVAIVSFSIENGCIELGKAMFVKNKNWSSYLRNLASY